MADKPAPKSPSADTNTTPRAATPETAAGSSAELAAANARIEELERANARLEERAERDVAEIRRLQGILDDLASSRREELVAQGAEPVSGVVRLRAIRGIRFTLNGQRKAVRAGDVVEARVEDLTDDGLTLGADFEVARR